MGLEYCWRHCWKTLLEFFWKTFCVLYRPDSFNLSQFFAELEKLLHFLKTSKHESFVFGDLSIYTPEIDEDKTKHYKILKAYDFVIRNSLPTRETLTSKSCFDHLITQKIVGTETS